MGLAVHLLLNETSGLVCADASGSNNPGTPSRDLALTYLAAKIGGGYNANGSSDFISIAHTVALRFASGFTAAAWLKLASNAAATNAQIVGKSNGSSSGGGWGIFQTGSGANKINVTLFDGSFPSPTFTTTAAIPLGEWVHLAVTWDGTTNAGSIKVYFNGVLQAGAEANYGTLPAANNLNVGIGACVNPAYYVTGAFDDVRLDPDIYTLAMIQSIVNGGAGTELAYPWLGRRRRLLLAGVPR